MRIEKENSFSMFILYNFVIFALFSTRLIFHYIRVSYGNIDAYETKKLISIELKGRVGARLA